MLRPIAGVENSKFHPIVRQIKCPAQVKNSPRAANFIRTALRKNNEATIEQVLKANSDIRRVEPTKEHREIEM